MSESRTDFVIQKYRLFELTFIDAEDKGKKLGHGKLMDEETFKKFQEGDPSGNFKYLDWMLFIAGGGQDSMEKSLNLWDGENASDPNSLRNQCRQDFIDEHVQGFTDEKGTYHKPITRPAAEEEWKKWENRSKFEFVMGDQDVAMEDGYGFYRHWPGKNGVYPQIVNAIKLWHMAQSKLQAQNKRFEMYHALKGQKNLSQDQGRFMEKFEADPVTKMVELDIYAGWRPREYSQKNANYSSLSALLATLADVRKMQVLKDIRYELIYESELVTVLCPLTIGASIKFGIGKWCVSNRTDFDRTFEATPNAASNNHWASYCGKGPLVYLNWKVPMPPFLHKFALNIDKASLKRLVPGGVSGASWVDCENSQNGGVNYDEVVKRFLEEHARTTSGKKNKDAGILQAAQHHSASDEAYYEWGGRKPGRAWDTREIGSSRVDELNKALKAVTKWANGFDLNRIVLDYITDVSAVLE